MYKMSDSYGSYVNPSFYLMPSRQCTPTKAVTKGHCVDSIKATYFVNTAIFHNHILHTLTFPQIPCIDVGLAKVGHPARIKLLIRLLLSMGVTPGGQGTCRVKYKQFSEVRWQPRDGRGKSGSSLRPTLLKLLWSSLGGGCVGGGGGAGQHGTAPRNETGCGFITILVCLLFQCLILFTPRPHQQTIKI